MAPSAPHLAEELLHLTCRRPETAVVTGCGERVVRHLREEPPLDLTAVYRAALAVFEIEPPPMEPPTRLQVAEQQGQVIEERDRLIGRLSRMVE